MENDTSFQDPTPEQIESRRKLEQVLNSDSEFLGELNSGREVTEDEAVDDDK